MGLNAREDSVTGLDCCESLLCHLDQWFSRSNGARSVSGRQGCCLKPLEGPHRCRPLGYWSKILPSSADSYFPSEKQLLAFIETECLTVDHWPMQPELPLKNWFCLVCQTIELDMHSSIPSSDGSGIYVIKPDQALKSQVSYMKKCLIAHSFHSCYTVVSPSLHLWPHEEFPMITLLSTLYSWNHNDLEVSVIISISISILRKMKQRMGNTLPRTIPAGVMLWHQSDTNISLWQTCHTIFSKIPQGKCWRFLF